MSHVEQRADREQRVQGAAVLARPQARSSVGKTYTLKLGTLEAPVAVEAIERVIDTSDLSSKPAERIERNGAGEVVLRTKRLLALDEHLANPITGRFVLVEDYLPVGGGIVSMDGYPDQRGLVTVRSTNITAVGHSVTREARAVRNGHKGGVLVVHRPVGRRQVDAGAGARARAVRQGLLTSTCWTATTSAAASTPISASAPRTGPRTSAASARWRRCSPMPAAW